jgi:hypothetical protein
MKFNSNLRIKLSLEKYERLWREHSSHFYFYQFRMNFEQVSGLFETSRRRKCVRGFHSHLFYFKIVDKQKYLLAKIKYGI